MLGRQPKRLAGSVFLSAAFDVGILLIVLMLARMPAGRGATTLENHDVNPLAVARRTRSRRRWRRRRQQDARFRRAWRNVAGLTQSRKP